MIILGYHDLDPSQRNAWTLHPDRFEGHLGFLKDRGYEFVSMTTGLLRCQQAVAAIHIKKLVVLSFDDQRAGAWDFGLPILVKFKAPAIFYVCPGLWLPEIPKNERYSKFMPQSQVRQLAVRGHEIGSHAMRHASMLRQSTSDLKRQVYFSMVDLYKATGRWPAHFAPPYGDTDNDIRYEVENAGYESLVTTELGTVRRFYDPHCLPRYQVRSDDSDEVFRATIERLEEMDGQDT